MMLRIRLLAVGFLLLAGLSGYGWTIRVDLGGLGFLAL